MNRYRIYWLESSDLRNGVVESSDISNAVQSGCSPPGMSQYISVSYGMVNGYPVVKVELMLDMAPTD